MPYIVTINVTYLNQLEQGCHICLTTLLPTQVFLYRTCWLAFASIHGADWRKKYLQMYDSCEVVWVTDGITRLNSISEGSLECPGKWTNSCFTITDISKFKKVSNLLQARSHLAYTVFCKLSTPQVQWFLDIYRILRCSSSTGMVELEQPFHRCCLGSLKPKQTPRVYLLTIGSESCYYWSYIRKIRVNTNAWVV